MRLISPYPLTWDTTTLVIHLCDPEPVPAGTLVQPGAREGSAEFQTAEERNAFIAARGMETARTESTTPPPAEES